MNRESKTPYDRSEERIDEKGEPGETRAADIVVQLDKQDDGLGAHKLTGLYSGLDKTRLRSTDSPEDIQRIARSSLATTQSTSRTTRQEKRIFEANLRYATEVRNAQVHTPSEDTLLQAYIAKLTRNSATSTITIRTHGETLSAQEAIQHLEKKTPIGKSMLEEETHEAILTATDRLDYRRTGPTIRNLQKKALMLAANFGYSQKTKPRDEYSFLIKPGTKAIIQGVPCTVLLPMSDHENPRYIVRDDKTGMEYEVPRKTVEILVK